VKKDGESRGLVLMYFKAEGCEEVWFKREEGEAAKSAFMDSRGE